MNGTNFMNYSNIVVDKFGNQKMQVTFSQLFSSLQIQFVNILLIGSVAFLALVICVFEITRPISPTWKDVYDGKINWESNPKECKFLFLRTLAGICLPISLFFTLLMISVKMGLNL